MSRVMRTACVVCLAVAALGQLVQYLVTPLANEGVSPAAMVAEAAGRPGAMGLARWLDLAILFLVPATLVVGWLAGAPRSVLANVGTAITFLATLMGSAYLFAIDVLVYTGDAQAVGAYTGDALVSTVTLVFLAGHVVGPIILAVALVRSGSVPWWAGVAVGLSPVLEIGGQAIGLSALTVLADLLLVAAFGACAVAVSHMPEKAVVLAS